MNQVQGQGHSQSKSIKEGEKRSKISEMIKCIKNEKEESEHRKLQELKHQFLYKCHFLHRKDKFYKRFAKKIGNRNDMILSSKIIPEIYQEQIDDIENNRLNERYFSRED